MEIFHAQGWFEFAYLVSANVFCGKHVWIPRYFSFVNLISASPFLAFLSTCWLPGVGFLLLCPSVKNLFTGILLLDWILRFHWSYCMCCKYFLLIFSVSFKGIFAKVLFSIIACVNLCLCFLGTFAYHIDSLCFFLKFIIFLFIFTPRHIVHLKCIIFLWFEVFSKFIL